MKSSSHFMLALERAFVSENFTVERNKIIPNIVSKANTMYGRRKSLLNDDHVFIIDMKHELANNIECLTSIHQHLRDFVQRQYLLPGGWPWRFPLVVTVAITDEEIPNEEITFFCQHSLVPFFAKSLWIEANALFLIDLRRQEIVSLEPPDLRDPIAVERASTIVKDLCFIAFRTQKRRIFVDF
jgi:hypothetical protein